MKFSKNAKIAVLCGAILLGMATFGGSSSQQATTTPPQVENVTSDTNQVESVSADAPVVTAAPTMTATPTLLPTFTPIPTAIPVQSGLSNDDYYTNSAGNEVHSPAYANTVPQGASAVCGDGSYSFSQSRRGTCSHHGGVAQWL